MNRHYWSVESAILLSTSLGALVGALGGLVMQVVLFRRIRDDLHQDAKVTKEAAEQLAKLVEQAEASQAWFWTPEWQDGEREADADIAAGRSMVFKTPEDMEEYLASMSLPRAAGRSA